LQWQWGKRTRAMAMALGQGHWGNSNCNDNGDGVWAEMCMFYFEDQCQVLWLLKACKKCGRPLFLKLFL
jgi:hypothetical protein